MTAIHAVGIPWYKPENFERLRALFADGHTLQRTHSDWLATAELACKRLEADGHRVVRVDIDPDVFANWCRAQGKNLDSEGRKHYASFMAAKAVRGTSGQ